MAISIPRGGAGAASGLYAKHETIYPREVQGRFASLRRWAVVLLLGIYYLLPWCQFHGRQAVLFDLPARKFYLFGLILWPQDLIYLTWLLVLAGLSLFFFTAIAGRLWCGYACPQTVWTELFVDIERFIEGDRARRMKRDRGPWTVDKSWRKFAKHASWLLLAVWTGLTFVGFFNPISPLVRSALHGELSGWPLFWAAFYGLATYGNAGFLREQVCEYMCPYARFQSAMFDTGTLVITYDAKRGEPRGPHARGVDPRSLGQGDCVDCTLCVQACPTGIDIREGLQYECIACAACIDACDSVMDKLSRPRGLVRYSTAAGGRAASILRPRILVYAALLITIAIVGATSLVLRPRVALDVLRDRGVLYRETSSGVENVYSLKILNKDEQQHRFRLSVAGMTGAAIDPTDDLTVPAGEILSTTVRVIAPPGSSHGGRAIVFTLADADHPHRTITERSRFIAPQ